MAVAITPYTPAHRRPVLALSVRAWEPVFPLIRAAVPGFVYESFYPRGWRERQTEDLGAVLDGEPENVDVAIVDGAVAGWVCTRLHPVDDMGEVYVLAVDPDHQRRGVGTALTDRACERVRAAGLRMVMAETGGDPGHAPARAAYEAYGFERWPVARYFRDLRGQDRAPTTARRRHGAPVPPGSEAAVEATTPSHP
ncbi:GNAT family N-acetyltransferase [Pseudonocardia tropica]|uniref:GNAT family N-acetyltransferase n=1 Tax=Pseudonocardia tropica TaxID=681289 RepID=A0ABV1JNP3_9PSEU